MVSYAEAVKLLKDDGEFHPYQTFYVYGNPYSRRILLFEKFNLFQQFIRTFPHSYKYYLICGCGVPSKSCLEHLKKFKNKQILYFGDLDAIGLWVYLTYVFGNRKFGKNSKKNFNIKFLGITPEDYRMVLNKKEIKIKIKDYEKKILEFIKKINNKAILDKISFLNKGYKIESEMLSVVGYDNYFKTIFKEF